ncbi:MULTISPECIES: tRNA (guanine-N1)-methyltransferase [Spirulina sp. CCY15215]|uniref:tRNA (guanine-N1)-methyltransferase n=1 Tax=Spirulina sp. CCY15215 TaxID=2767591 RepID=UPI00195238BA|nr:tRNA (guanine-N1)-methyltransferase [Spirulina major]
MIQEEGKAQFSIGKAFFRPESRIVRDLGVLAAAIYRQEMGQLRVLEAMAGCGVRSLRYWLESGANWLLTNEGNPDRRSLLEANLHAAIASQQCQVTCENVHRLFFRCFDRKDYYDLVDVDGFGSAAPYLSTALWATKIGGLIYITSTDGRTGTGHLPQNSLANYGAYARSHPAAQEQSLRLIIGAMQQQAASQGRGIEPIFSFYIGETYRIMVRLLSQQQITPENYGFLGYCHACGEYKTISWRKLGQCICSCDRTPLTLTGAMWLGVLHDRLTLKKMQDLAREWGWNACVKLLEIMIGEADFPPYFYTLGEIGRRGKMDIPPRSRLIEALKNRGDRATITHINPEAIKTDADMVTCIKVARSLNSKLP